MRFSAVRKPSEDITMAAGAGKSSKRRRYIDTDSAANHKKMKVDDEDMLSGLPDNILHHILSFIDTKLMVQTSILSRRWRSVWEEVTALNFNECYFPDVSKFEQHVDKVLSLRSKSAAISSVTLNHWGCFKGEENRDRDELRYWQLFDSIMEHAAASHRLHHLSVSVAGRRCCFANMACSIRAHGHHESLKTLKLQELNLEFFGGTVLALGFKVLTNLELRNCQLFEVPQTVKSAVVDPFANLPCLKYLKLGYCDSMPSCLLRVSGLELLDLQIECPFESSWPQKIEVFAPKLESFCFEGGTEQLGELNFPSRAYTKIHVKQRSTTEEDYDFEEDYDEAKILEVKERRREWIEKLSTIYRAGFY